MHNETSRSRTALIVDDDHTMLSLLDEVLTEAGFATELFDRGQDAVNALMQQRFDLLIADVSLPDMNGMDICNIARERYHNKIVIVVITGADIRPRRLASLGLYADDFLEKPFDVEELAARIESKLRRMDADSA